MSEAEQNAGRRAVFLAVRSFLADNGLTPTAVRQMVESGVGKIVAQIAREKFDSPTYMAGLLSNRAFSSAYDAIRRGTKDAVERSIVVKHGLLGDHRNEYGAMYQLFVDMGVKVTEYNRLATFKKTGSLPDDVEYAIIAGEAIYCFDENRTYVGQLTNGGMVLRCNPKPE